MALQELNALSLLLDRLDLAVNQDTDKIKNLSTAIDSMEKTLQQMNADSKEEVQKEFYELYNLVKPLEREEVSQQELHRLHKIVSEYYNFHLDGQQDNIRLFRRKLRQLDS